MSDTKNVDTDKLDPLGYEDGLLVRAALKMFGDWLAAELDDNTGTAEVRETWTRDLIRVRWLANRSWYNATLSPRMLDNERDRAMEQLQAIAAGALG